MTLGGQPLRSVAVENLYKILKQGHRMNQPHNCPDEIYFLMMQCWQDNPEKRWTFVDIEKYLAEMIEWSASAVSRQIFRISFCFMKIFFFRKASI